MSEKQRAEISHGLQNPAQDFWPPSPPQSTFKDLVG